jgi:hypothetical protein
MKNLLPFLTALMTTATVVLADGPKDNVPGEVRPIPPEGIAVPDEVRDRLTKGLQGLAQAIEAAKSAQAKNPAMLELLPDVEIYHKAVDWALRYGEFHKEREFKLAEDLITEGSARARQLREGKAPWTSLKGPVVRAYRSRIDGSVQPYGMMIPESYSGAPMRLDTWFHGRGETLSELVFLGQVRSGKLKIAPKDTLVLQPYGRYSNANKFAGEIDLLEALDHAGRDYRIDPQRIIVRGFSMGTMPIGGVRPVPGLDSLRRPSSCSVSRERMSTASRGSSRNCGTGTTRPTTR